MKIKYTPEDPELLCKFLEGKQPHALMLFHYFIAEFEKIGAITVHAGKTMTGITNTRVKIAYVSQLGRDFIHVVFTFRQPHYDNLCFQKIVPWPGDDVRFTHHFRMLFKEDLNDEVCDFMRLAYDS
jgi:hypothetical protein